jgi:hypothetical protein
VTVLLEEPEAPDLRLPGVGDDDEEERHICRGID